VYIVIYHVSFAYSRVIINKKLFSESELSEIEMSTFQVRLFQLSLNLVKQ